MKKRISRLTAIVLAAVMVISLLPMGVFAYVVKAGRYAMPDSEGYTLTTSVPGESNDIYEIVHSGSNVTTTPLTCLIYYNGRIMRPTANGNNLATAAATPSNNVITGNFAANEWTITRSGNGYTIRSAAGNYLNIGSSTLSATPSNQPAVFTTEIGNNTVRFSNGGYSIDSFGTDTFGGWQTKATGNGNQFMYVYGKTANNRYERTTELQPTTVGSSIESGEKYLVFHNNYVMSSQALGPILDRTAVTASNGTITVPENSLENCEWTATASGSGFTFRNYNGYYLRAGSSALSATAGNTAQVFTTTESNDIFTIGNGSQSIDFGNYSGNNGFGGWTTEPTNANQNHYLYKYVRTESTGTIETDIDYFAKINYNNSNISQSLRQLTNIQAGQTYQLTIDSNIDRTAADTTTTWASSDTSIATIDSNGLITLTGVEGYTIISLIVTKTIDSVEYSATDYIKIFTYEGDIAPFTDTSDTDNFPIYPAEGSVAITKSVIDTENYLSDGIARLELGVKGVPLSLPSDIVLVLDISSSMNGEIAKDIDTELTDTKFLVMKTNAVEFANRLLTDTENNLAIVKFSSYTHATTVPSGGAANTGTAYGVVTGSQVADETAFVGGDQLSTVVSQINDITVGSGTNYDCALAHAVKMLEDKKAVNLANGENRNQIIVYMTDGLPNQLNGNVWGRNVDRKYQLFYKDAFLANGHTIGTTTTSAAMRADSSYYKYGDYKNSYWELVWTAWMAGNIGFLYNDLGQVLYVTADNYVATDGAQTPDRAHAKLDTAGYPYYAFDSEIHTYDENNNVLYVSADGQGTTTDPTLAQKNSSGTPYYAYNDSIYSLLFLQSIGDANGGNAYGDGSWDTLDTSSHDATNGDSMTIYGSTVESREFVGVQTANEGTNGSVINRIPEYCTDGMGTAAAYITNEMIENCAAGNTASTYTVDSFGNVNGTGFAVSMAAPGDVGNQESRYTIIAKDSGAKVYTIALGFAYSEDAFSQLESEQLLERMSSGVGYAYSANTTAQLTEAFRSINSSLTYAGTDAIVSDTLGQDFSLQFAPVHLRHTDITYSPTIVIKRYETNPDGTRNPQNPAILETVTFTADADDNLTSASSSLLTGNIYNAQTNTINASLFSYDFATKTFSWNVGTIIEDEYVIEYDVYLNGSMEGLAEAGSYPTNEVATLTYTNYMDNPCMLYYPVPRLPWEAAEVYYQFYLVDQHGNPVNSLGEQVSFSNRTIVVPETLYKQIHLNEATTSISPVSLLAEDVLPEGYFLYIENNVNPGYNVYVDSVTSLWSSTSTTGGAVVEYRGGSNGLIQRDNYTNMAVAFPVLFATTIMPDTVVIDYGLPVNINVLANDICADNNIYGLGTAPVMPTGANVYLDSSPYTATSLTGDYGEIAVFSLETSNTQMLRYTPTTDVHGIETFYYCAGNSNSSRYLTAAVKVIPATTVYYEDNFGGAVDWITYSSTWTTQGTVKTTASGTQDTDRPGTANLYNDANNNYGYDSSYDNFSDFSYGSTHVVTATSENNGQNTATFSFYGTGFDIISYTDTTTGYIIASVYSGTEVNAANRVNNQLIDTYYKGDADTHTGVGLFQIPVINCYDLPYGQYTVQIAVVYQPFLNDNYDPTKTQEENLAAYNSTFYLDAVRIYNPITKANSDFAEANAAYGLDSEAYETTYELRDILISENKLSHSGAGEGSGVVYVDGNSVADAVGDHEYQLERLIGDEATTVLDNLNARSYANTGPNNEVYLDSNQTVAFTITGNNLDRISSVQIGAKSVKGETEGGRLKVSYVSASTVSGITTYRQTMVLDREITSNTDMYYPITNAVRPESSEAGATTSKVIVVTNTGTGILSLSNVKITVDSSIANSSGNAQTGEEFIIEQVVSYSAPDSSSTVLSDSAVVASYLTFVNSRAGEGSVLTYSYGTETDREIGSVTAQGTDYNEGDTVVLTIKTSTDVERIEIKDEDGNIIAPIDLTAVPDGDGGLTWVVSFQPDATGRADYFITGYDSDNSASKESFAFSLKVNADEPDSPDNPDEPGNPDTPGDGGDSFVLTVLRNIYAYLESVIVQIIRAFRSVIGL